MATRNGVLTMRFSFVLVLMSLWGCASEATDGPEQSRSKLIRVAKPVSGEYIVVLEQRVGNRAMRAREVAVVAEQLLVPLSARAERYYTAAIQGFFVANLTEEEALALAEDPRVAYVQENGVVKVSTTQSPVTWGLDRIDQAALPLNNRYTYNFDGSGVKVYVIDTGIRATHSQLGGRVDSGFTSVTDGQGTNDCHGHGTHVAGTVGSLAYGVAKNVRLSPVRVLDCSGSGTDAGVIAGVDWVAANHTGPSVATLSLGGGASPTLDASIRNLVNAGVTTVVAAGNENQNACNVSPAREPLAITVASSTQTDARSPFSNYGSCVDIFAPGSGILSLGNGSDTTTALLSGTSMASAHVAGGAALILSANPMATPAQVVAALKADASPGRLSDVGTGSPNLLLRPLIGGGGGIPSCPLGTFDVISQPQSIPDGNAELSSKLVVNSNSTALSLAAGVSNAISFVTLSLSIRHASRGDLVVSLISPMGTSHMIRDRVGGDADDLVITGQVISAFAGEAASGIWTLRVQDAVTDEAGVLVSWSLQITLDSALTAMIISPVAGSTIHGAITLIAKANSCCGSVSHMRFALPDGTSITDSTAPYSATFDTSQVPDGNRNFSVTAIDDVGAATTVSVSANVSNSGAPGCLDGTFASADVPKSIIDNGTVNSTLAVAGNGTIATLALSLNISHTFRGDLVVSLIGPDGTAFVVSNRAGGSADNLVISNQAITSFVGKVAAGTWTLRIQDAAAVDVGILNSWSLRIVGGCGGGSTGWSGSSISSLPIVDNGQACSVVNVTGSGSSADAELTISGTHAWRSILRGTLSHNGVTMPAFSVGTFPANGGPFSLTDRHVPGLTGDAAGTWVLCVIDTDAFGDTGVLNAWSVHN